MSQRTKQLTRRNFLLTVGAGGRVGAPRSRSAAAAAGPLVQNFRLVARSTRRAKDGAGTAR